MSIRRGYHLFLAGALALAALVAGCDGDGRGPVQECNAIGLCVVGYAWDMTTCRCEPVEIACLPTVGEDHPYYGLHEGIGSDNACRQDADCVVGGCGGNVCAAESVITTCIGIPADLLPTGQCGCLDGQCRWHTCAVNQP